MKKLITPKMIQAGAECLTRVGWRIFEAQQAAEEIYATMEQQRQTDIRSKQVSAGIAESTKRSGKKWGRQPDPNTDNQKVIDLLNAGHSIREVATMTGVNRGKVHRISKTLTVEDLV